MNTQIRHGSLSSQDFLMLGINDVAYVKKTWQDEQEVYEIHSADGGTITAMASHDIAFAAVRQNGMEPLSVH